MRQRFIADKPVFNLRIIEPQRAADGVYECNINVIMMPQQRNPIGGNLIAVAVKMNFGAAEQDICIKILIRYGENPGTAGTVRGSHIHSTEQEILRKLMEINLLFGMNIFFHGTIMIQVFFMNVQQHTDMGGYMDVFQLMAGQLTDQLGIRMDFLQNIKGRNADIAGQDGIEPGFFQNMIKKRRGRTFSFGSGDADDTVPVGFEEDFHLGSEPAVILFRIFGKYYARTFEDQVIVIERVHIMLTAKGLCRSRKLYLILVSYGDGGKSAHFQNPVQSGMSFPSIAEDQDIFIFNLFF